MSHNEDKSKATQSTSNTVSNLNIQDNEGVTIVGDGNTTTTTDFGAISGAAGIASDALNGMVDVSLDAINLGREGLSAGTDNLNLGLGFAEKVYGDSLQWSGDAIQALADNQDSALSFLTNLVDSFGQTAQQFTDNAVAGFEALAVKSSESADDRVGKVAMYAFAAVAAVFIFGKK